nr:methylmalonyl-CoA mutase family protein [Actinomycetota bacterium]
AYDYFRQIEEMGGVVRAIENGFQMGEIAEASARYQRETENGTRKIVNVNIYEPRDESDVETHRIDPAVSEGQLQRLKDLKERRDNTEVEECLEAIKKACRKGENTMYPTIEAVRAYATVGEISSAMQEVYGTYRETPVI